MVQTLRATLRHLGAIGAFSLPAVAIFWHAWDGHMASVATCACSDAGQQIWFVAWPAYALAHGLNPFFSSAVWAPRGTNLLVNASSPLVGVVLAPVTLLWGPVVSTNVALTLAPALSAWGCWIACRHFVSWRWAALPAALLFGYSPFVVSNLRQGHLGLGLLAIPPIMLVLLSTIFSTQRGPAWRAGAALGVLAAVQFLVSPEVLVMGVVVGVIGTAAAAFSIRAWTRQRVRYALNALAVSLGVGLPLLALPAWFVLDGPQHLVGPVWPGLDLFGNSLGSVLNLDSLVPAHQAASTGPVGASPAVLGLTGPNPAYLGVAVVVLGVLALAAAWRKPTAWVLCACASGSFVLSLGSALFRHDSLASVRWLPWQWLVKWPLVDDVLPGRFALYTDLAVCVLLALGLGEARRHLGRPRHVSSVLLGDNWTFYGSYRKEGRAWRAYEAAAPGAMVCLAVLIVIGSTLWWYSVPTSTQRVDVPAWFATAGTEVPPGSVVLAYPFPASASLTSQPMIWQAVDEMRFSLAGGYVKVPGPSGGPLEAGPSGSAVNSLVELTLTRQTLGGSFDPTSADLSALRAALRRWKVSYVVVTTTGPSSPYTAAVMTAVTGLAPTVSHRAWVWDLRRAPLASSYDAENAASAFAGCRWSPAFYGQVRPREQLPLQGVTCVADAL